MRPNFFLFKPIFVRNTQKFKPFLNQLKKCGQKFTLKSIKPHISLAGNKRGKTLSILNTVQKINKMWFLNKNRKHFF